MNNPILLIAFALALVLSACSKYQFQNIDDSANSSLSAPNESGNNSTEITPPLPGVPINQPGTQPGTAPGSEAQQEPDSWLENNCNPQKIMASPMPETYAPKGGPIALQQISQADLNLDDNQAIKIQNSAFGNLNISKAGTIGIQQVVAGTMHIDAQLVAQFQQIAAGEIFLRARVIDTSIQQILAGLHGPNLQVQAWEAKSVQQVSALCLRVGSADSIQKVFRAIVIGEGSGHIKNIQQVGVLTLINAHVDQVQQVGKLILINSTVGSMDQIGEVVQK